MYRSSCKRSDEKTSPDDWNHADITESKTNEQRAQMQARRSQTLFEELRKQKSKNVALEQFTAIASHDLGSLYNMVVTQAFTVKCG